MLEMKQQKLSRKLRDLAFFAMAVAVHTCLLLLPLKSWQEQQPAPPVRITVQLQALAAPETVLQEPGSTKETADSEPPPGPDLPEPVVAEEQTALQEEPPTVIESESVDESSEESRIVRIPDAWQFLESPKSADDLRWLEQAEQPGRALGSAPMFRMPRNWERHAGAEYFAEFDNTFNGMTVPAEVEIVDRWLAADGSHRVVLNLPDGRTLCGRAEPYNPMQPLFEPIMLFGTCGGGGKRSFSMPERHHLNR